MKNPELLRNETADSAEEALKTLRLIARVPAPDGLVDRVQARLQSAILTAPRSRQVLAWPPALTQGGWGYGSAIRGAAAAAIVCVVAGGGWRIYSHVQPAPSARVVVMPAPAAGSGRGFSIGGSVHTPDPQLGPVLTHQVVPEPSELRPPGASQPASAAQARKRSKGPKPGQPEGLPK
jgi:hypothetical protein